MILDIWFDVVLFISIHNLYIHDFINIHLYIDIILDIESKWMFFRLEQRLGPALGCRSAVPSGQTLHGTNPSGDGTLVSEATRCLFFWIDMLKATDIYFTISDDIYGFCEE